MKRDFVSVPANDAQALRDALPAELSDVNGGWLIFTSAVFPSWYVPTPPVGPQHGPILPVVTLPAGQPTAPPYTTPS